MIRQAGFENVEFMGKTGFNSSPATVGVLIHATKRQPADIQQVTETEKKKSFDAEPAGGLQIQSHIDKGGST